MQAAAVRATPLKRLRFIRRPAVLLALAVGQIPGAGSLADSRVIASGPSQVHLIELYTSEGCSSCPPAEDWLSRLKKDPALWRRFVPVAFHVDYWDYLGWPDPFAAPEWSARQRAHAARWRVRGVYTPGFVLDGREWRTRVLPRGAPETIGSLWLEADGDKVRVTFSPAAAPGPHDVYLARLGSGLVTKVAAGENHGRTLVHDFVVLSLQKAELPPGETDLELTLDPLPAHKADALAGWITPRGSLVPIQAAGGWLAE